MTVRELKEAREEGLNLKILTQAYAEIAAINLNRTKKEVLTTRSFYQEIAGLYQIVKQMAQQRPGYTQPAKQKTVSLLLTSNYRFNGLLNSTITTFFQDQTSQIPTDRIVIGQLEKIDQAISLVFKKDLPDTQELTELVNLLKNYSQILVYYCEFQTVLKQIPVVRNITQANTKQTQDNSALYIFEPEISKILDFFDRQIKTTLLSQIFLEAELARVAARLISMDQAQDNANKYLQTQQKLLNQARTTLENRGFLENWILYANRKESTSI